ncbi:Hypothetical protein NTJ_04768 [Nesidiocoris tenuis]|uniref:Gustatory receptor n=1 Tax=Nesidiocoris tenuis TaxID=355587 RepID=A0ABN7AI69_9HEMI|nr:Hypothetical protein NTJ_04768 [Nesidiocoris tenuis]
MDFQLLALLCISCIFKMLCIGFHIYRMIAKRKKFMNLLLLCYSEDFKSNKYRKITLAGFFLWPIPLAIRQSIALELFPVLYGVAGFLDILCIFIIVMQYCTFLEIAKNRFTALRYSLYTKLCKFDKLTDAHNDVINFTRLAHSMYSQTILIEICYLGYDFMVALYDSIQTIRIHHHTRWGVCTFIYSMACLLTIYTLCRACELAQNKVNH